MSALSASSPTYAAGSTSIKQSGASVRTCILIAYGPSSRVRCSSTPTLSGTILKALLTASEGTRRRRRSDQLWHVSAHAVAIRAVVARRLCPRDRARSGNRDARLRQHLARRAPFL